MFRESLGFFFAKDFTVFGVFFQDFCFVDFVGSSYGRFTKQESIKIEGARSVNGSWQELCFCCIRRFEYDG